MCHRPANIPKSAFPLILERDLWAVGRGACPPPLARILCLQQPFHSCSAGVPPVGSQGPNGVLKRFTARSCRRPASDEVSMGLLLTKNMHKKNLHQSPCVSKDIGSRGEGNASACSACGAWTSGLRGLVCDAMVTARACVWDMTCGLCFTCLHPRSPMPPAPVDGRVARVGGAHPTSLPHGCKQTSSRVRSTKRGPAAQTVTPGRRSEEVGSKCATACTIALMAAQRLQKCAVRPNGRLSLHPALREQARQMHPGMWRRARQQGMIPLGAANAPARGATLLRMRLRCRAVSRQARGRYDAAAACRRSLEDGSQVPATQPPDVGELLTAE